MNETRLQMKTLLYYDAYSEGLIRVGYKRHLDVGLSNLLALSLSCRDSPMVLAHTAMPLSCSMHHAPCLPTDLLSVTMKLGDYVGRGKRQVCYVLIISRFALWQAAFHGHSLQESVSRFQYDQGRSGDVPSA